MKKQIRDLIPEKDRVFYLSIDVINRGQSLSGLLDGTVLEVHCDGAMCWLVTVSGVHRKHEPWFEYEIVPESYDKHVEFHPQAMVKIPSGTMYKGRSID